MSFESVVAGAWPPAVWAETHVIVAISGGADSCAMLAALARLKPNAGGEIIAAHFNHGLRGAAANADAAFVEQFAQRLGVRVVVGRGDVAQAAALAGDGMEAAARAARYEFLLETAQQFGARYVATAHTADDQVETVLHRMVRGTGIAGLVGMRPARPLSDSVTLIRPLLRLRRNDVLEYLAQRGLAYCEDETNHDRRFTRNRLRHELLPLLRSSYNTDIDSAILRLAQLAGENQTIIDNLVETLKSRAAMIEANRVSVSAPRLQHEPRYLIRELFVTLWRQMGWPLQAMGFVEWETLAEMLRSETQATPAQRIFPGNIQATKKGEQLVLTRL